MDINSALLSISGLLGDDSGGGSSILVNKNINQNGVYLPIDDGADGYKKVSVNVPSPTLVAKAITENGTYAASSDNADGYYSVTVDVAGAPPENISVLFKNHSESSGTIAIGAEMYNATYGVISGQALTSVSVGNTTTKTAAKQGNYIVATVNVVLTAVYYNGNQLPASFTGGGAVRFAIIELPSNYDNTIPIELKR